MLTKLARAVLWVMLVATLATAMATLREWQLLGAGIRAVVAHTIGGPK